MTMSSAGDSLSRQTPVFLQRVKPGGTNGELTMCVNCRALETEIEAQQDVDGSGMDAVRVHPETDVRKLVL